MREHFGRIVGTTPLAYRLAFRGQTVKQMRAKAKIDLSVLARIAPTCTDRMDPHRDGRRDGSQDSRARQERSGLTAGASRGSAPALS
jgi:hypothetical protein